MEGRTGGQTAERAAALRSDRKAENNTMIRHIVFDYGHVLIRWDPDRIIARLGVVGEDARLLRREVFDCSEWPALDRGTMTPEEALARMDHRLPAHLLGAAERCVRDWWKDELIWTEGIEELIRELDGLGYKIYVLTNAASSLHGYVGRLPAADCFRGMIVSADWKLLKPQREIYETLFRQYGLRPEECFFIDDNPMNIEGARCAGMPGAVFFNDVARLRRELIEAGIPVRAPGSEGEK